MGSNTGAAYLTEAVRVLRQYKTMADRAVAQLEPDAIFDVLDDESNSIAVIMQHMAGNMRSRWTDFLTSDGEKPNRNRDAEFHRSIRLFVAHCHTSHGHCADDTADQRCDREPGGRHIHWTYHSHRRWRTRIARLHSGNSDVGAAGWTGRGADRDSNVWFQPR